MQEYCRELVRRLVFGAAGDELPAVAQSVAQALVAQRWPKAEEWAALGAEYDNALVLMGAQRPGLNGVEDPDQMISYAKLFAKCRQLEALLCWERYGGDLANVVYAAWVAGVRFGLSAAMTDDDNLPAKVAQLLSEPRPRRLATAEGS